MCPFCITLYLNLTEIVKFIQDDPVKMEITIKENKIITKLILSIKYILIIVLNF